MIDINNDCDRVILAYYPRGAGGKFLINCLSLSSNAVMQHRRLARMSLAGKLDTDAKLRFLMRRLTQTRRSLKWDDLALGDMHLYGHRFWDWWGTTGPPPQGAFDAVINQLSHGNFFFFSVAHTRDEITHWRKLWKRSLIIKFQNANGFVRWRGENFGIPALSHAEKTWKATRGIDWPMESPKTIEHYWSLPEAITKEEQTLHQGTFFKQLEADCLTNTFLEQPHHIPWNCDWFMDENSAVDNVGVLYRRLGLENFQPDFVRSFYQDWLKTLDILKSKQSN